MTEVVTNGELFDRAIATEELARHLYLQLSKKFGDIEEIKNVWLSMADDEEKHSKELQTVKEKLSEDILNSKADKKIIEKLVSIEYITRLVDINRVLTLRDAYELAHELESTEVNNLFLFLRIQFFPEDVKKEILINHLSSHTNKLQIIKPHIKRV